MKDALSGDFEEMIIALLMPLLEYDAMCLRDAMDGLGTNEDLINSILISRTLKVFINTLTPFLNIPRNSNHTESPSCC